MGMFDEVNYECACPVCHAKVSGFQSKDGDCVLETVQPSQVDNFYTTCDKCGCWVEFNAVKKENTAFTRTVRKKLTVLDEHTKTVNIRQEPSQ